MDSVDDNRHGDSDSAAHATTNGNGNGAGSEPIVESLKTAGGDVPDTLHELVYGKDGRDIPSLESDSAEGVTTFAGMSEADDSQAARAWLSDRLERVLSTNGNRNGNGHVEETRSDEPAEPAEPSP